MPWVNVDFYTPVDEQGEYLDVRAAILAANQLTRQQKLRYRNPVHNDFFESSEETPEGYVFARAARVRMRGLPGKFVGGEGQLRDLDLEATDGVAEEVNFLFCHELQVLALQRNGGFRSTQVETLLRDVTDLPVSLMPKVRADQAQRLQDFDKISAVHFRLGDPNNLPSFQDSLPSVGRTITEASQVGDLASVEVIIRMRVGQGSPQDVGVLRRLVRSLRGNDTTSKLLTSGKQGDSNMEHIDLLRDRIVAGGEIDFGDGRRLDGEACKLLLRRALNDNRPLLRALQNEA